MKRREMHVPSFKHTGRAKAKHKCRFTYTVWPDVRARVLSSFREKLNVNKWSIGQVM